MFPVYISKMDYTYKLIITVSKQEVHIRDTVRPGQQYSLASRGTSHLPAEDDAKTESARQRHRTKRDKDETST